MTKPVRKNATGAKRKGVSKKTLPRKKVRVKKKMPKNLLTLRNTRFEDYPALQEIMDLVYANMGGAWTEEQFQSQLARFPEGQICIEDNGKLVGAAISMVVDYDKYTDNHNYKQITGNGYITTHDPLGDTLYGVDIFVHPKARHMRLGRRLYDARKELVESLNLRRMIVGGRIPGYQQDKADMTPQKYILMVANKERYDPILSFQLANDFHVRRVVRGYMPEDTESQAYAVLLEWINIYYEEKPKLIGAAKAVVRIGALQWQMRQVPSFDVFREQVEYFVDVVARYKADFVVFPEYFNAPLMSLSGGRDDADAIRKLAEYTSELNEFLQSLAVRYNTNIVAGSMPEYKNMVLRNVSNLFRRDGTSDHQYKLHITPDESQCWGLQGGTDLRVFDTDVGKIGILVCYDVEFPELSRLQADLGMKILFVPYWTDTKSAYLRVRRCAQARAIENECYVVITGSVGNIPNIHNMDIQYSQSAVFSPSDFAFPHDAVIAEATPNTEMSLICDLDLDLLKELRVQGSVRNLRDRRLDLYRIVWQKG